MIGVLQEKCAELDGQVSQLQFENQQLKSQVQKSSEKRKGEDVEVIKLRAELQSKERQISQLQCDYQKLAEINESQGQSLELTHKGIQKESMLKIEELININQQLFDEIELYKKKLEDKDCQMKQQEILMKDELQSATFKLSQLQKIFAQYQQVPRPRSRSRAARACTYTLR